MFVSRKVRQAGCVAEVIRRITVIDGVNFRLLAGAHARGEIVSAQNKEEKKNNWNIFKLFVNFLYQRAPAAGRGHLHRRNGRLPTVKH